MKEQKENPRLKADLEGNYLLDKRSRNVVGLFYAPSGGSVHKVAKRIKQKLQNIPVDMLHIKELKPEKMLEYRNLIFVSSTLGRDAWNNESDDEWAAFLPGIRQLNLEGRKVALVGLGNHVLYANNFVDGLHDLAEVLRKSGAVLIGITASDQYTFEMSRAMENGMFIGLPLDEDNEPEKTDSRIDRWLEKILPALNSGK